MDAYTNKIAMLEQTRRQDEKEHKKSEKELQRDAQEGIQESVERAEEGDLLEEAITEGFKSEGTRLKELFERRKAEWTDSFNMYKANMKRHPWIGMLQSCSTLFASLRGR